MCKLLQRCEERNIALNSGENKFILKEEQLPYMGHIFPPDGLRPDPAKVKAITDMPSPDGPQGSKNLFRASRRIFRTGPGCHFSGRIFFFILVAIVRQDSKV